jgi:hypothetical protein
MAGVNRNCEGCAVHLKGREYLTTYTEEEGRLTERLKEMRKKWSGSRRAFQIRFVLTSCVCALIELYIVGAQRKKHGAARIRRRCGT